MACLRAVYPYASYVTVNISSPNTAGLRELQEGPRAREPSGDAQGGADEARAKASQIHSAGGEDRAGSHDGRDSADRRAADAIQDRRRHRDQHHRRPRRRLPAQAHAEEEGLVRAPAQGQGDGGDPDSANALRGSLPIIGVGGIMSGADAAEKIAAGASLVQIYTGLIYKGPELVAEIAEALAPKPSA